MNPGELLDVLERKGAVLNGHFVLSSGRHSDVFVQKFRVLEHPRLTQSIGEAIAQAWPEGFDVVASPALGAVVLGFSVALASNARFVFAERDDGRLALRRGFEIRPHERVLVVEDVITTGGSAAEVVSLIAESDGRCIGVGALLDRADATRSVDLGVPLRALVKLPAQSWDPSECPLCATNQPIVDPGSRRL